MMGVSWKLSKGGALTISPRMVEKVESIRLTNAIVSRPDLFCQYKVQWFNNEQRVQGISLWGILRWQGVHTSNSMSSARRNLVYQKAASNVTTGVWKSWPLTMEVRMFQCRDLTTGVWKSWPLTMEVRMFQCQDFFHSSVPRQSIEDLFKNGGKGRACPTDRRTIGLICSVNTTRYKDSTTKNW